MNPKKKKIKPTQEGRMAAATLPEEMELIEKHEEILGRRAQLLQQMELHRQQLHVQRKQRLTASEDARHRNNALLQDLQKIEERLRGNLLPHPNLLALQTRYWASVEESAAAWEHFLLGKGPHPTDDPGRPHRTGKQTPGTPRDQNQGRPPRPKPKPRPPR